MKKECFFFRVKSFSTFRTASLPKWGGVNYAGGSLPSCILFLSKPIFLADFKSSSMKLKNKKLTFVGTLFVFLFLTSTSEGLFYFFHRCFPRHIILKDASAFHAKHSQVTTNIKQVHCPKFFGKVRQKILTKNGDTPVMHSFSVPETLQNTEGPQNTNFFSTQIFFDIVFWYAFCASTKILHRTKRQHQKFPESLEDSEKPKGLRC